MNDIEKSDRDTPYAKYERLLLERDALKKEAGSCLTAYLRTFGEWIGKVFEKKVDCISKKKSIAFCQAAVNRGEMIHADELQKYLASTMAAYQKQLAEMTEDYKKARLAKESSEYACVRSKSLYRKIAKCIHPDINPSVWKYPEISDLWDRTVLAYGMNDVGELEAVEVLVHKVLDDHGFEPDEIKIDNLEERIRQLEAENLRIRNTDPYQYKNLLEDPEAVSQKKKALEEEYASYVKYAEELSGVLAEYIKKGMIVKWEEN
jgi:3-methyladenine DNA glycosylase AlkC